MLSRIQLNNTDLQVSQICYGTNMLGTALDQDRSAAILDKFVSLGGNFLDSARSYGDWIPDAPVGASERAIGAWLKGRNRSDVVIATKGCMVDMRAGDWRNRVTPADLNKDLGESLSHLEIDQIDLYWLHADNPQVPVGEIVDCLIEHQQAGRIRYFGASNWSGDRVLEAQRYAGAKGHQGFAAVQPFWGLAGPNLEAAAAQGYVLYYEEGMAKAHEAGLTMIPYSSQSRGYFTKVDAGGEESLPEALKAFYLNDVNRARLAAIRSISARHGVTINEVVLAYLLCQPLQTIPIIGATRPEQLEESVKAVSLKLSPDELRQLRAA